MSEVSVSMDSVEKKKSKDHKKRHRHNHDEKRHRKKKKRSAEQEEELKLNGTMPLINGVDESANNQDASEVTSPQQSNIQNGNHDENSPSPAKRKNPFSVLSSDSSNKSLSPPDKAPMSSPTSQATTPFSSSTPKKVIQFQESDSEDGDFNPKRNRMDFKSLSPRHAKFPKAGFLSPKKIDTRESLRNKRRQLQAEREKLPIWTGRTPHDLD